MPCANDRLEFDADLRSVARFRPDAGAMDAQPEVIRARDEPRAILGPRQRVHAARVADKRLRDIELREPEVGAVSQ